MTGEGKMWLKMFPMFAILTLLATFLLLSGFYKTLGNLAPDSCKFYNEWMPYPCIQCDTKNFSNSTTSVLPERLDEMCFLLSNTSSPQYNETRSWGVYTIKP